MTRDLGPPFCTVAMAEAGRGPARVPGRPPSSRHQRPGTCAPHPSPSHRSAQRVLPHHPLRGRKPRRSGRVTWDRSPEPGSRAPRTSAPTSAAGGRVPASARVTSGARRPLGEGLSRVLQDVCRSRRPLPAGCPSPRDHPRRLQTLSHVPEAPGVGTTNCPLSGITARRQGRQHGRARS